MSRLVQIPVTGERVSDDIVDRMRTVADPKHLKHFGHAGPKFVRQMLDGGYDADRITREVGVKVSEIIGGEGDREQQRRASRGLAYLWLAADIAKEAQLVPGDFDVRSFILGLWEKVKGGADTTKGVVGKVCSSLSTGLRSGDIAIYSRKGDALSSGDGAVCFEEFGPEKVPAFVLSQAALGRLVGSRETVVDAAKILAEAGLIYREQSDRLYWRSGRAGVGNVSSYAIYARAVLGDDANDIIERHRSVRADKPGGHSGGG